MFLDIPAVGAAQKPDRKG